MRLVGSCGHLFCAGRDNSKPLGKMEAVLWIQGLLDSEPVHWGPPLLRAMGRGLSVQVVWGKRRPSRAAGAPGNKQRAL